MDKKMYSTKQSYLKMVLICLTLLSLSSCANKTLLQHYENTPHGKEDITGWQKSYWGMNVEEVDNLYPLKGDFKADDGLFESGFKGVDGHFYKSHIIPSPNYWDKLPTIVSFYFDKNDSTGKLVRVKLMLMTQFGKIDFEQTPLSGFFRFIIRKHGWPYQYHPVKGGGTTVYYWRGLSGMIQTRFTQNKIKRGLWNYIFTTNHSKFCFLVWRSVCIKEFN